MLRIMANEIIPVLYQKRMEWRKRHSFLWLTLKKIKWKFFGLVNAKGFKERNETDFELRTLMDVKATLMLHWAFRQRVQKIKASYCLYYFIEQAYVIHKKKVKLLAMHRRIHSVQKKFLQFMAKKKYFISDIHQLFRQFYGAVVYWLEQ